MMLMQTHSQPTSGRRYTGTGAMTNDASFDRIWTIGATKLTRLGVRWGRRNASQ